MLCNILLLIATVKCYKKEGVSVTWTPSSKIISGRFNFSKPFVKLFPCPVL